MRQQNKSDTVLLTSRFNLFRILSDCYRGI